MASHIFALFLYLSALISLSTAQNAAMLCSDHPVYDPANPYNPVLLSSWSVLASKTVLEEFAYLPHHTEHQYVPATYTDGALQFAVSDVYKGLDLLHFANRKDYPNMQLFTTRPAKIYMFLDVNYDSSAPSQVAKQMTLIGWQSEGWAYLNQGGYEVRYGVHDSLTRNLSIFSYVFSKSTFEEDGEHTAYIQSPRFIKQKTVNNGISINGRYNVFLAEADGSASTDVGLFEGQSIPPNTRCPDALHDRWVTQDPNTADTHTAGIDFQTYHPQWDPCFWCAYDHDHGSNPAQMRYKPMFGYTALKNYDMDEPNQGFKGYLFHVKKYLIYVNLHSQLSNIRRVHTRFHTMNIVVTERGVSKKILMDLRYKADFGFEAVKIADNSFIPLNEDEKAIKDAQSVVQFKSINVLDIANMDTTLKFKKPYTQGVYEEWISLPMCAKAKSKKRSFQFTFKRPNTGILSVAQPDTEVKLFAPYDGKEGGTYYDYVVNSTNLYRSIRFAKVNFDEALCQFDPRMYNSTGEFYTNPNASVILPGPGPNAVRQFIEPGFKLYLNGKYETAEHWSGLYEKQSRGFFINPGFGIDAAVN